MTGVAKATEEASEAREIATVKGMMAAGDTRTVGETTVVKEGETKAAKESSGT